ncbi:MAG: hypothetical protein FWD51_03530 [Betaproteobacteria bacterium]|nr:hypothetical protein [Betaproteobacteria bacterium]
MTTKENGRLRSGQKKESSTYSIANRVKFTRWRDKNAWKRSLKAAIIHCADIGEIWPETAERLIRAGGLLHV